MPKRITQTGEQMSSVAAARVVARLNRAPTMADLSPRAASVVMGIRMMAVCDRAGRDPVGELTCRLGSVAAAKAILDLADLCGAYWPENVTVTRPCCRSLTPDEHTLAQMAEAAESGDRGGFHNVLSGFVRGERHDALYAKAIAAVAAN